MMLLNIYSCFILAYWSYGVFSVVFVTLLPRVAERTFSPWLLVLFLLLSLLTLVSFLRSLRSDPGRLSPSTLQLYLLQFRRSNRPALTACERCAQPRPERAHHCTRCGVCVLKMDHHCPWINNCVGANNQWLFVLLLLYTVAMCVAALALTLSDLLGPVGRARDAFLHRHRLLFLRLNVGVSVLMLCAAGFLLLLQACVIRLNTTTLEMMFALRAGRGSPQFAAMTRRVALGSDGKLVTRLRRTCGMRAPLLHWLSPLREKSYLINEEVLELSKYNV